MVCLVPTRKNSSSKDDQKKTLETNISVTLLLENKLSPLKIPQICATPLGNFKAKNPRPMEIPHDFFLITPKKSTSFLTDWLIIDSFVNTRFFLQFKGHVSGRKHGNYTNDPISSANCDALIVCNIHFWIWKNSKLISRLWSILACKILQFLARSYRSAQLIILLQKIDILSY